MKLQNTKPKFQINSKLQIPKTKRILNFGHWNFGIIWDLLLGAGDFRERGITLLIVVVILSALLSVSIGIFDVVFGQIKISGEIADSFKAFYAADKAIERFLYLDRVGGGLADGYQEDTTASASEIGCYRIHIRKTPAVCGTGINACITATGQYRCGPNPTRTVKRGFSVTY